MTTSASATTSTWITLARCRVHRTLRLSLPRPCVVLLQASVHAPASVRCGAAAVVEASYAGARMGEGDTITLEFVNQMMADFKAEKRLHKR